MAANFPNSPNTNDTFTENGLTFGIDDFGKSAPYKDIFNHFGLTKEKKQNEEETEAIIESPVLSGFYPELL